MCSSATLSRPFSEIPDHSSSGLALRRRLVVLRLTFASMRRSFEARVGRVAMRGRGTNVARRTSSARRSRASSRFCSCVRKRSARMTSTPSRQPPAGKPHQPPADGGRQARRTGDIEAQLDGGRNLIDVLPAGSRGAYELLAQLRLRDIDGARHAQQAEASLVSSVAPEPYSAPRCFASTAYPTRKTLQGRLRYLYEADRPNAHRFRYALLVLARP
jgi:hypothetical protein